MRTLLLAALLLLAGQASAQYVNVGGVLIPVTSTFTFVAQTMQMDTVLDEGDTKCAHVLVSTTAYSLNAQGTAWGTATFSACRKCTYVREVRDVTVWVEQPSGKVPSEFDVRISSAAKKQKPIAGEVEAIK